MEKELKEQLKQKLLREKELLELELTDAGALYRADASDYAGTAGDLEVNPEDKSELADKFEEIQANESIVTNLEQRLEEVKKALEKIEKGNYGICEVCGNEIEEERLLANPAATTCTKHMQ